MGAPEVETVEGSPSSEARCLNCDYPLRQLPESRCPECGRSFDPLNASTVNATGKPFPGWARLSTRRVGWLMHLLTLAPLAVTLWELRRPGGEVPAALAGLALWFLIGPLWLIRLLTCAAILNIYKRPVGAIRWRRWLIAPVLFVMWFILTDAEWPQRMAFHLSRASLERVAHEAMDAPGSFQGSRQAGLLRVVGVERIPEGVRLYTGPGYDDVPCGYAFCPNGRPPDGSFNRYYPWDEGWWEFWAHDERTTWGTLAPLATVPSATRTTAPTVP